MVIYLCPTDKKYACSWEGSAEDILPHFEQEHDDLLHFNDTFEIDLEVSSENRLFFLDEEIYLAQIRVSNNIMEIFLRYLGPDRIACQLSYNIIFKFNYELCPASCITVRNGYVSVDLSKLEYLESVRTLQCTLIISRIETGANSDEDVFLERNFQETELDGRLPHMPLQRQKKVEEDNISCITTNTRKQLKTNTDVSLSRSKTINLEDYKRKHIKRCMSTLSLGAIEENEFSVNCTTCGVILVPPIYLCPCGQSFCSKCQTGICCFCNESVTFKRNEELEDNFTRFLLPCKYKTFGCPEKLIYTELRNHENNCIFCEYKCPIDGCGFEGLFKHMRKHLKVIHGSTKMLESFIVVFQNIPEAFLVNEDKGIFYCFVRYFDDRVLWQAQFCGPKERRFFCELKFKDGKLKQPLLLKRTGIVYSVEIYLQDLKRMKLKSKHAILTITS
nr:uncharacterized protein LOC111514372 [Leptinotarsa decemlineata]XP_023026379.1 uncharacterized protein LOC111514372 [Leptinotarsa decemlineata]XP_023026380.1 uncharacterized protein LOC111514372 [Leptinotarsa decemlineata]